MDLIKSDGVCMSELCSCAGLDVKTLRELFLERPVVEMCGGIEMRSFQTAVQAGSCTEIGREQPTFRSETRLDDILLQYSGSVQDFKWRKAWSLTGFLERVSVLVIEFKQRMLLQSSKILDIIIQCLPLGGLADPLENVRRKSVAEVLEMMERNQVMPKMAASLVQLCDSSAEKGQQDFTTQGNDKFSEAIYGDIGAFYDGLEGKIGVPNPKVLKAIKDEHCASNDSKEDFKTSNYNITTSPK